jgi:hypothetical protein
VSKVVPIGKGKKRKKKIPVAPDDADRFEQLCCRLELAWRMAPDLRLGELITEAQRNALSPQYVLEDEDLMTAIEAFAQEYRR